MNSNVIIKSFSNGLKINLSEDCTFACILSEIREKFTESASFFKGGKVAITFEGRKLTEEEEKTIILAMEEAAGMTVLYVCGKDEESNNNYAKAVSKLEFGRSHDSYSKIYYGSLKKGETVKFDTSVVIVGDVEPGSYVYARGNIIILGGLYGTAICEASDNEEELFVYSNDFSTENIKIGDYSYYSREKSKWVVKPKLSPKIAYVSNHQVALENVSSKFLDYINIRQVTE